MRQLRRDYSNHVFKTLVAMSMVTLVACDIDGGDGTSRYCYPPGMITLVGSVTGLLPGRGVSLQVSGTESTIVSGNGTFTLASPLQSGSAYAVTVSAQPQGETCTLDPSGNLWMFGGYGADSNGTAGFLNDLWTFNLATNSWAWVGGSNTVNASGSYGALGATADDNVPGGDSAAVSISDAAGNFWLFGGYGYDSAGNVGYLNSLWKYVR